MIEWKREESSVDPSEFEIGVTTVYMRRNVKEKDDENGNIKYEYEECKMTIDQYNEYLKLRESVAYFAFCEKIDELKSILKKIVKR